LKRRSDMELGERLGRMIGFKKKKEDVLARL